MILLSAALLPAGWAGTGLAPGRAGERSCSSEGHCLKPSAGAIIKITTDDGDKDVQHGFFVSSLHSIQRFQLCAACTSTFLQSRAAAALVQSV